MDKTNQQFCHIIPGTANSHFPLKTNIHAQHCVPNLVTPTTTIASPVIYSNKTSNIRPDFTRNIPIEIENLTEFNTNFGLRANKETDVNNHIVCNMNKQMQTMQDNMLAMHEQMQERFKQMNLPHMPPLPAMSSWNTHPHSIHTLPQVRSMSCDNIQQRNELNPFNSLPASHSTHPKKYIHDHKNMANLKNNNMNIKYASQTLPMPIKSSSKSEMAQKPSKYQTLPTKASLKHGQHIVPNNVRSPLQSMISKDSRGADTLKLAFDMADFKPEEISVSKDKNHLEVNAHHEEKQPDKISCKVFHQSYNLPKDMRITKLNSMVNPDGTLVVQSPIKPRHRVKFADVHR